MHIFTDKSGRKISIYMTENVSFLTLSPKDFFLKEGMKKLGEYTNISPKFNPAFINHLLSSPMPEYSFFSSINTKLKNYAFYAGWCKAVPTMKRYCFSNTNFSGYGCKCIFDEENGGGSAVVSDSLLTVPKEEDYNGAIFSIYRNELGRFYSLTFDGKFTDNELKSILSTVYFFE